MRDVWNCEYWQPIQDLEISRVTEKYTLTVKLLWLGPYLEWNSYVILIPVQEYRTYPRH